MVWAPRSPYPHPPGVYLLWELLSGGILDPDVVVAGDPHGVGAQVPLPPSPGVYLPWELLSGGILEPDVVVAGDAHGVGAQVSERGCRCA